METKFFITCAQWKEWNSLKNNFKYEYRTRQKGERRSFLLFYSYKSSSEPMALPVGNALAEFKNDIHVVVFDSVGDFVDFYFEVTVSP